MQRFYKPSSNHPSCSRYTHAPERPYGGHGHEQPTHIVVFGVQHHAAWLKEQRDPFHK
jgi:hypothetical protein